MLTAAGGGGDLGDEVSVGCTELVELLRNVGYDTVTRLDFSLQLLR
jgi:hypothetical protein